MRKDSLYFRAQNLDNSGDDVLIEIKKDGTPEDVSEEKLQYKIVGEISEVALKGKKIEDKPTLVIYRKESDFFFEAVPEQKDVAGRKAPIIIYSKLPQIWSEDWRQNVYDEITKFAKSINRSFTQNTLNEIFQSLEFVYRDYEQKKTQLHQLKSFQKDLIISLALPLILALLINTQIPAMIEQVVKQNQNSQETTTQVMQSPEKLTPTSPQINLSQQQLTPLMLEKITQRVILWIAVLIAVNNAMMTTLKFLIKQTNR